MTTIAVKKAIAKKQNQRKIKKTSNKNRKAHSDDSNDDEKEPSDSSEENSDEPAKKRQTRSKKPQKKAKTKKANDPNVIKFKQAKQEAEAFTVAQLKEELSANDQPKTGKKDELVARVADGHAFGKIPRCPKCFLGKPRYDVATDKYKCPGGFEDDNFVRCSWTSKGLTSVQRETWKKLELK